MQIKYLIGSEKQNTRSCYENNFPEDTGVFIDYYYKYKVADNQILVVELENKKIGAMLHLNPYFICLGKKEVLLNYIVAVATDISYRHQGFMSQLLQRMMSDMYEKKEPFTFLMPADKAIYEPFGFIFIYEQNRFKYLLEKNVSCEKKYLTGQITCKPVDGSQIEQLATFAQSYLQEKQQIFAKRCSLYYQNLLEEQEAQQGEIIGFYNGNQLVGYFYYIQETLLEIREFVIQPQWCKEAWEQFNAYFCLIEQEEPILIQGFLEDSILTSAKCKVIKVPIMMGRIIHLPTFLDMLEVVENITLILSITDSKIPENNGTFLWEKEEHKSSLTRSQEKADIHFTVEELTAYMFGRMTVEELLESKQLEEKDIILEKMKHIKPFSKIFLNEIM